eukprot:scaffold12841_cov118-Cylindrotheca_fusiformis.AAC.2
MPVKGSRIWFSRTFEHLRSHELNEFDVLSRFYLRMKVVCSTSAYPQFDPSTHSSSIIGTMEEYERLATKHPNGR